MEHKEPQTAENKDVSIWLEPAQERIPAAPLPPSQPNEPPAARHNPRARKHGWWRYLGLLTAGLCCYTVLTILASLVWGYIAYSRQGYISGEGWLPVYIFLGAIFFSSCLVTALGRGGVIFPALLFSLLANTMSFLLAESSLPPLKDILIKLGLSLLCAAVGFTITKLLIIIRRP